MENSTPVSLSPAKTAPRIAWAHVVCGVLGLGLSLYTVHLHNLAKAGKATGCGISTTISCDKVLAHPVWGEFLGLPLGFWGAAFFVIVLVTAVSTNQNFNPRGAALQRLGVATVGILTSLGLEWIMWRVIGALCPFCMATHAVTLANFLFAIWGLWKAQPIPTD